MAKGVPFRLYCQIIQKSIVLAIMLLSYAIQSSGQTVCSSKLELAHQLFESGQIEEIPAMLDSCMKNGFTRLEKVQAYRLLIQVYLFDNNLEKANNTMYQMLRDIKTYTLQITDPVEFRELFNSYKLSPSWAIGFSATANLSMANIIQSYTVASSITADKKYQTDGPGWNIGINLKRFLTNRFWLNTDISYQNLRYATIEWLNAQQTEQLTFKEQSQWANIPVTLNFAILSKDITPFIFAGGGISYLLQAKEETSSNTPGDYNGSSIVTSTRNSLNPFANGGVGLSVNSTAGLFQFSLGYVWNFSDYSKTSDRFADLGQILYQQHMDDVFRLNNLYFTVSYVHLFYHIRKKQTP